MYLKEESLEEKTCVKDPSLKLCIIFKPRVCEGELAQIIEHLLSLEEVPGSILKFSNFRGTNLENVLQLINLDTNGQN